MPVYDVVIAGAAPAGSIAALVLARAGYQVALLDRADFPRRKICGN
jgi:flavin-dependent dehydrogenase